eukprot:TRINITY_DN15523_c0_g1_i1.p3 TRINITY_DN15523_c0_g1~~TRINITY_DN15523_c0_g1_i1.p3  ORF type:complete len:222 (+),score=7.52 TRINITY_DN15523_c0_g1_i1:71-667(+)
MIGASYKLVCLLFCVMYFFSVLGVQLFGGTIIEQSPVSFTMNDIMGAFMILIELLEIQNIEDLTNIYTKFMGDRGARIFFSVTFNLMILICLNLVLSYVIDIFNKEFDRKLISSKEEQEACKSQLKIVGHEVFFQGRLVEKELGNLCEEQLEGEYCATLYNWTYQSQNGGIEEEIQIQNIFGLKAQAVDDAIYLQASQ